MALRLPPPVDTTGWNTGSWCEWLANTGAIHSVRNNDTAVCRSCRRPVGRNDSGIPWDRCFQCYNAYSSVVERVVPISYSTSPNGLTSLIAQAKNEPGREWLRAPLASLLHDFLQRHWPCLQRAAGGDIDAIVPIPSHLSTRGGVDHLAQIHGRIVPPWRPIEWSFGLLTKLQPNAADSRRNHVARDLFAVRADISVRDWRIVLVDDLYTSGSTSASAAAALVDAGAHRPIVLTLGRQIRADDETAHDLLAQLDTRTYEHDSCAIAPDLGPFANLWS